MNTSLRRSGQNFLYGSRACESPECHNCSEGCSCQDPVIKLNETGIFKHVSPPEVTIVGRTAVELIPELGLRWRQPKAHVGEFVVDQARIEAGNQTSRHGGDKDQSGK